MSHPDRDGKFCNVETRIIGRRVGPRGSNEICYMKRILAVLARNNLNKVYSFPFSLSLSLSLSLYLPAF
jgi:hypothetical protein